MKTEWYTTLPFFCLKSSKSTIRRYSCGLKLVFRVFKLYMPMKRGLSFRIRRMNKVIKSEVSIEFLVVFHSCASLILKQSLRIKSKVLNLKNVLTQK